MGQFGIGQPVRRFEDKRLLSGNGRFQHDVSLPGQAYAYVLRSPHAHAAIRAMDLSAAQAAPGVLAIYTGDDLAAAGMGTMGVPLRRQRPDGSPMFWRAHLGSRGSGCAMSANPSRSSSPRAWRRQKTPPS
jgi:carbon-monoxide dehydrogenase large subunit